MVRVRLRPATLRDVPLLDKWAARPDIYEGEFNDFDLPVRSYQQAVETGQIIDENAGLLVVEELAIPGPVGAVTWHAINYAPNPQSRAWNIGIALVPEARGRELGVEAQRLLLAYLFSTTAVNRVEAATDVDNVAEQRALEKAGLHREGVLRGAQYRAGAWHDIILYARLRSDR
jgi:RimJ/RimL family protein N-acetyltransferase